jgi:hypothetical protein
MHVFCMHHKVNSGRFIPLCHYDPKYTKECNNMIMNTHISMFSTRAKPSTHRHSDTTNAFVAWKTKKFLCANHYLTNIISRRW